MMSTGSARARLALVAAVAVPVAVLAACSNSELDASPPGDLSNLQGHTYVSTGATGHQLVEGSQVTLHFADGQLSARAGCNTLGGAYTVDGGTLRWTGTPRSTMMACEPQLMQQDAWLTEFLQHGAAATLHGSMLTLASDGTTITLGQQDGK